jgi:hypothetical protein
MAHAKQLKVTRFVPAGRSKITPSQNAKSEKKMAKSKKQNATMFVQFCDDVRAVDTSRVKNFSDSEVLYVIGEFLEDQLDRPKPDLDDLVNFGEVLRKAKIDGVEEFLAKFVLGHNESQNHLRLVVFFGLGYWPKRKTASESLIQFLVHNYGVFRRADLEDHLLTNTWQAMHLALKARVRGLRPSQVDTCSALKTELRHVLSKSDVGKSTKISLNNRARYEERSMEIAEA